MAITQAPLTSGGSTTDATTYDTASITPSANKLILAAIASNDDDDGASPTVPTLSGNGLTWVEIANVIIELNGEPHRVTLFRSMGASPSAGAVTITFGAENQLNCGWSIAEFDGVDTGGTNGSAAVVQSATVQAGATSATVTLAAFGSADNATYGAFHIHRNNDPSGITPGTGFTEIHEAQVGVAGFITGLILETEWRADNDTSVDASTTNSVVVGWGAIAVEIKAAAAGDPEGLLIGGKLIGRGLLGGALIN